MRSGIFLGLLSFWFGKAPLFGYIVAIHRIQANSQKQIFDKSELEMPPLKNINANHCNVGGRTRDNRSFGGCLNQMWQASRIVPDIHHECHDLHGFCWLTKSDKYTDRHNHKSQIKVQIQTHRYFVGEWPSSDPILASNSIFPRPPCLTLIVQQRFTWTLHCAVFFYKLSTNYIKSKMLHVTIMCIALAIGEQIEWTF